MILSCDHIILTRDYFRGMSYSSKVAENHNRDVSFSGEEKKEEGLHKISKSVSFLIEIGRLQIEMQFKKLRKLAESDQLKARSSELCFLYM